MFNAFALVALTAIMAPLPGEAQEVDVRAQVSIVHPKPRKSTPASEEPQAVLWLKPLDPPPSFHPPQPGQFRMTQKNRMFQPHLLVIPLGSTVSFPNLDPFFHNVFSQFNGKRFDLGLYEAGSTRDVRFDHEGVSYLFCNIHPEMGAVIITVTSPWQAITTGGSIAFHQVPAGWYELHVWADGADARQLNALTRKVRIGPGQNDLGTISIETGAQVPTHKNKFGDDYPTAAPAQY
jgi:hypothetical protein